MLNYNDSNRVQRISENDHTNSLAIQVTYSKVYTKIDTLRVNTLKLFISQCWINKVRKMPIETDRKNCPINAVDCSILTFPPNIS